MPIIEAIMAKIQTIILSAIARSPRTVSNSSYVNSLRRACTDATSRLDQGSTVQVTVTDYCQSCALEDLDFAPAAFSQLTGLTGTRVHGMTWTFD